ncbi:phosphatase PAP2 family protein [Sporosarcina sp. Marseille-Q4063]|uniref:phosphatase PAP2 family protein n=1 Tax=Sporosarcina sp. Marseille-Q4063 TaxID=2810514 RepID=UPI001BAEEBAF|nr:phosphatase PAP2 family protein [Sporosarcina sp. Marseille-Q4063]QUW20543.1 phosphatase PAP2 family protein [Sporosarcina sp. Marseille-Q4063]
MKQISQTLTIAFILCAGFGLLFGYFSTTIGDDSLSSFDTIMINAIQGLETPWLTAIMKFFTWIGSGYVVAPLTVIAAVLLVFVFKYRHQALLLVVVIGGTVAFNHLLKLYFKRERPVFHRILDANGYSFPSGHTMMAFSLYVIIAYIAWRNVETRLGKVLLIVFATFMTVMIGTSRIYLGVHYPSDVAGGLMASGFLVTIAVTIYSLYLRRFNKEL